MGLDLLGITTLNAFGFPILTKTINGWAIVIHILQNETRQAQLWQLYSITSKPLYISNDNTLFECIALFASKLSTISHFLF